MTTARDRTTDRELGDVRGQGDRNEVALRGRVSGVPERRVLPSGDEVVTVRVVVRREEGRAVDTVPVVVGPGPASGRRARPGQVGRRLLVATEQLAPDQRVEVVGHLHRRWWEAGGARRSRIEVRATSVVALTGTGSPA